MKIKKCHNNFNTIIRKDNQLIWVVFNNKIARYYNFNEIVLICKVRGITLVNQPNGLTVKMGLKVYNFRINRSQLEQLILKSYRLSKKLIKV